MLSIEKKNLPSFPSQMSSRERKRSPDGDLGPEQSTCSIRYPLAFSSFNKEKEFAARPIADTVICLLATKNSDAVSGCPSASCYGSGAYPPA